MRFSYIISKTIFKFEPIYIIYIKSYNKIHINVKFQKITVNVYTIKSNIFIILE